MFIETIHSFLTHGMFKEWNRQMKNRGGYYEITIPDAI